jgi:HEPN domain-containing protein
MEDIPDDLKKAMRAHLDGKDPPPLYARIFRAARDWHASSHRALEWRGEGTEFNCLVNQALVQQAFACELYLKALFALENGQEPKRRHELDKLFEPISGDTKGKIKNRYLERYWHGSIPNDLCSFAQYFRDWRYSYEIKEEAVGDLAGIAHLASALYETCIELKTDLACKGEVHERITAEEQGVPIHDNLAAKLGAVRESAKPLERK